MASLWHRYLIPGRFAGWRGWLRLWVPGLRIGSSSGKRFSGSTQSGLHDPPPPPPVPSPEGGVLNCTIRISIMPSATRLSPARVL